MSVQQSIDSMSFALIEKTNTPNSNQAHKPDVLLEFYHPMQRVALVGEQRIGFVERDVGWVGALDLGLAGQKRRSKAWLAP